MSDKIKVSFDLTMLANKFLDDNYLYCKTLEEETFYEMTKDGDNPEFVEKILDVIDSIPSNEKTGLCLFGLSILASDEEMNQKEQNLFIRISE